MATLYEFKEYGYRKLSRQSPEKRAANIAALTYLEKIAAHSQTNISHWDVNELFSAGRGNDFITDQKELNKRFFEHRAKMTENFDENERVLREKVDVVAQTRFKSVINGRREQIQHQIMRNEESIAAHYRDINNLREHVLNNRMTLMKLEGKEFDLASEITNIERDNFFKLEEFNNTEFIFSTKSDIILGEKNPAANLDYFVNLGRFKVKVVIANFKVAVLPFERNFKVREERYYHPHVYQDGNVCFGDIANQANTHLNQGNLREYMKLLAALLSSYSNHNPYVPLTFFKEASERAGGKPIIVIEDEMPF